MKLLSEGECIENSYNAKNYELRVLKRYSGEIVEVRYELTLRLN